MNEIKEKVQWQYDQFMQTELMLIVATIVALIVGVVSYTYRVARVWYNNGGREFIITSAAKFTAGVHKLTEKIYFTLEDAEYA